MGFGVLNWTYSRVVALQSVQLQSKRTIHVLCSLERTQTATQMAWDLMDGMMFSLPG